MNWATTEGRHACQEFVWVRMELGMMRYPIMALFNCPCLTGNQEQRSSANRRRNQESIQKTTQPPVMKMSQIFLL